MKFSVAATGIAFVFAALSGMPTAPAVSYAAPVKVIPMRSLATTATQQLVTSTYLGGTGVDYGRAVGRDAQGNIYVAIDTFSSNINGMDFQNAGDQDILVVKLSPDSKEILGGIALGGTSTDRVGGMAVTPQGEVVLAVATDSPGFPLKNPIHDFAPSGNRGVLLKLNAALDDLVFSTYTLTTVAPNLHDVGVDSAGNIVLASYLYSPSTRARDMVVEKFSPDGQQSLYTKNWAGDTVDERPQAISVQPDGTTFIAGYTEGWHSDFAVTDNALQKTCGRKLASPDSDCDQDGFVVKLDGAGNVKYASYLGGNGNDKATGIAVDTQGAMYLFGSTDAPDFPTTSGAFETQCPVDSTINRCYYDMFVSKIAPDGSKLAYSTYLTSNDKNGLEYPGTIAVDAQGNATVVGTTASQAFPVKNAFQSGLNSAPCPNSFQDRLCFDATITTFNTNGALVFSSYLGGKFDEYGNDVMLGTDGSIYMVGSTESLDFPTTPGVTQPTARSGKDAFLVHIGASGATPQPPQGKQRAYIPLIER